MASATFLTTSIRTLTAFAEDGSDLVITDHHKSKKRALNNIKEATISSSKDTITNSSKDIISSMHKDITKDVITDDVTECSLLEVLFGMALKKMSSDTWNEKETRLLDQLDSPFIDINTTLCNVIKSILIKDKSDMDASDLITLKLCLSRIVNLMNPKQAERVVQYLEIDSQRKQVQGSIDEFLKHGMNKDAHEAYDKILDVFDTGGCLEDALIMIDALKKPLLERRERNTDMYRMLKIMEHVLGYLYSCKDGDSEATVYRRIAMIMDELFCDTGVMLADGETCSECTKNTRLYNDMVFGTSSDSSFGRKIDLLIKFGDNQELEISSNEFKKNGVTPAMAVMQQCKNLRVNGSILDALQRLDARKTVKQVVAMDWLGYVGYMFTLLDINGVYFGEKIGVLLLPKSVKDLHTFIVTLDILFCYKHFIISLGEEALSAWNRRQNMDILREVIDVSNSSPLGQHQHHIFFTPTHCRTKKARDGQT
ncbi:hypothetical protein EC973_003037 [Apophysomyces ossiformis]|uniref:Uncharacterized protein n=1 Tax=Apophysomyces ossiformis TaxID=679940 RepID=A0A8H7BY49_9FUNG|nr:hypothetical protein EC973_003037 [Apophysomyces ossiformis]